MMIDPLSPPFAANPAAQPRRRRGLRLVPFLLAGASAALGVESLVNALLEQGVEAAVAGDASMEIESKPGLGRLGADFGVRMMAGVVFASDDALELVGALAG